MTIKLHFDDPFMISEKAIQDIISIQMNETIAKKFFWSPTIDNHLHPSNWIMKSKIPRQLPDTGFTRSIKTLAKNSEIGLKVSTLVCIMLNLAFGMGGQDNML